MMGMETPSTRIINLIPAVALAFALVLLRDVVAQIAQPLLLIALAIIIAAGLNPLVVWSHTRLRVSRGFAAGLILFLLLLGFSLLLWFLVPTLVNQLASLINGIPSQAERLQRTLLDLVERTPWLAGSAENVRNLNLSGQLSSLLSYVPTTLAGAVGATTNLFNGLLLAVLLLLMGFSMLVQPEPLLRGILSALPLDYRDNVGRALLQIGKQLGGWLNATVLLSLVMTLLVGLGLLILGLFGIRVENIFLFAVIAGVTQVIPVVGPLFGLIPPVVASLGVPANALWIGITVFAAQQIVFQVLSPIVFSRGVSLHPASLLGGVLIFSGLFGVVGAFLAVPFLIIVKALYEELYLKRPGMQAVSEEEVYKLIVES
jgi:putative permease